VTTGANEIPTVRRAARFLVEALKLMRAKDHDYGDAWKELSIPSHVDRIKVKLVRITKLLELKARGEEAQVSEGIRAEVMDVINYATFIALALEDQEHEQRAGLPQSDGAVLPLRETA
jgi:hypothetical protein